MSDRQLFGRIKKVTFDAGAYTATYSSEGEEGLEIRFEIPFDDDSKPNESKVEIYNLSDDSVAKIKRGIFCTVQAGYRGDVGVIASGVVSRALTQSEGVNKITTVYVLEGEDFSTIKVTEKTADPAERYTSRAKKGQSKTQKMQISFKADTKADVIVRKLVSVLGIKLATAPKLVRNKVYKKGYVVTGLILNNLEEVVRDCGSIIYYRRGRLVIRPLKEGFDERFTLEESTGLLGSPQPFENDGDSGYTAKCLLQHRITVASIIELKSKAANGRYRARKGKHVATGSDFYTEVECV